MAPRLQPIAVFSNDANQSPAQTALGKQQQQQQKAASAPLIDVVQLHLRARAP